MRRAHPTRSTVRGFTLLEAIMAIVITGIIAGMVAVFIARPIKGYADSVRRAGLTDTADGALKRMGLDIRTAVPNSLRVDASGHFVEFIPARLGGRYCTDTDAGCDALDFNSTDTQFDVLGPTHDAAVGEALVIFNTGQTGLDAYAGDNRRTISNIGTTTTAISFTGARFPFASPSNRFQVVPATGPVTFACENLGGTATGTGTLKRYTGYGYHGTQPTTGLGTGALLADGLADCHFAYQTVNATNGLVGLFLRLLSDSETVSLVHQIHVDNMP